MAGDMFLYIDGIKGESTDDAHKEWIELESWSFGMNQRSSGSAKSTGGARTAERVDISDIVVTKQIDKASAPLAFHCANGKHIKEVKIEVCRASEKKEKYYEILMNDVLVSSVQPSQATGSIPTESISFDPGRIEWIYVEMDHKTGKPKGPIQHHWDMTANKGG